MINAKKIIVACVRRYKPIDGKLRHFAPYAKLSRKLQKRYQIFKSDLKPVRAKGDLAKKYYGENYEEVSLKDNVILFECYWGKKICGNPLAIYRRLVNSNVDDDYKIIWVVNNIDIPEEVSGNKDVVIVKPGSKEYGHALLEATYLVNNVTFPTYFIRRPGQRYLNTWHGVPVKAMGRDMIAPMISMANTQRNFLQSNIILESSDFYRNSVIRPYYVESLTEKNILRSGSPRVDDIFTSYINDEDFRIRYGVSKGQKVVMYAPTWRGNSTKIKSVFNDQASIYQTIANLLGDEYFVIFSAHQMVKSRDLTELNNGAVLLESENINDVLVHVDVLVSDYSSIIFDFFPANKAVVLYTYDIEQYQEDRGLYVSPSELPCADVKTIEDLVAAIREGSLPSSFATYASMCERFIPLENGNASKSALTELLCNSNEDDVCASGKKRLLIAPGGLIPNGITSSLKNLISNLDYDKYDPYIVIEASVMDNDPLRREQFSEFDSRCNWVLRCGDMLLNENEKKTYQEFRQGSESFDPSDIDTIKRIFERENLRVFGDTKFDVSIEFGGYAPFWTALIAFSNASRKICYQHNHLWAEYTNTDVSRNQKQLYSVFLLYRYFDQIVAVSDETRMVNEEHLGTFYAEGVVAHTVNNTIDINRLKEKALVPVVLAHPPAAPLYQENSLFRFIALGRLSPEKRFDRMIGALAKIARKYPSAILIICGSGPLKKKLSQLAKRLGVSERVIFLGQVSNPYPLLAKADACVMSSDYEGQPMALLEALCLGTTCIGTDIPGIRSVLKDKLGHIVPPTVDDFSQAMEAAILKTLPPLSDMKVDEEYIERTMKTFYKVVCGQDKAERLIDR
ncbi:glycosyltransferase [Halomonas binhaiensis]|uniref:CDP-glycerol glycerophosphotransferase family protein n=1 Tax=Halomonas binhaiensis TaxID=2562282 RepID=A0A5C1NDM3_9GAMM|nr:glycosyltransferase [Halomonas binhaiensis]QEM80773.1 CDP-glycerol glycerophosphotransferase family protein [Halomonas binhaiensis]